VFHPVATFEFQLQNGIALESPELSVFRLLPACLAHRSSRAAAQRALLILTLLALSILPIGCGTKKQTTAQRVPPAHSISSSPSESSPTAAPVPGIHVDPKAKAIWSEVGYASWYGPQYNNKKAANGEVYHQNEMTAAHNTLPLNSIVRVVNLQNNHSTVVRITDRGPFVADRIIDLSVAAAKAVNVYLPGTAKVRLDVLEAPHPIETGGRWCVQIGAFQKQSDAIGLKKSLLHRYPDSQVIQFQGPTGYWVRIRVPQDDKQKTREVYQHTQAHTQAKEGGVFMVRLD
jgi:rare lipoprotein A